MIIRLILIAAALAAAFWIIQQFKKTPRNSQRSLYWKYGLAMAAIATVLLALTGRIHWIGAVIVATLPFIRSAMPALIKYFPHLQQWYRQQQGQPATHAGKQSSVTTATLRMQLDHNSQTLKGDVIAGPFQGQNLDNMSLEQLQQLLEYCRQRDSESNKLLATYLNHRFGNNWQKDSSTPPSNKPLDETEALAILGVQKGANRDEIVAAHRRLMQKFHPDRGGNDYLAARINQAKDLLLKKR